MNKLVAFVGISACLIFCSCSTHSEEHIDPVTFMITSPLEKDTTIIKEYVCQIHSTQHIELRALERGYLQEIFVDEGQFVKKGQLMFQIMPMLYKAEMQKAEAEVSFAEIEYQNTKMLADSVIVSKNELALAKAKLDKAKAELALAQAHFNFTEIRAPFDGIMDRFFVRVGSLLEEGELLTTLSDNSKMWVYFNVPESEYLDYITSTKKEGHQKVKLKMANNELFEYTGIVETVEADFNNETGNIAFRAGFQNPEKILRHGETGNILMPVPINHAVIIPQKATFDILDKKFVYVVDESNVVRSRQITVAQELPHLYIVSSGLKPSEKILAEGLGKVKNNEKIESRFEPISKVLSDLNNLHAE